MKIIHIISIFLDWWHISLILHNRTLEVKQLRSGFTFSMRSGINRQYANRKDLMVRTPSSMIHLLNFKYHNYIQIICCSINNSGSILKLENTMMRIELSA